MSHCPQTAEQSVAAARNRTDLYTRGRRRDGPSQVRPLQSLILTSALLVLPATFVVPAPLVLPTVSIIAVTVAGVVSAVAWSANVDFEGASLNAWDLAGLLAFIGVGSGMLSQPEAIQLLDLNSRR